MIDSTQIMLNLEELPESANNSVKKLNVRRMDVKNLLRGLGREYDLNMIVDNDIKQRATVRLSNLPAMEAVVHICEEYGLQISQSGQVFRIGKYTPPKPKKKPRIPDITRTDSLLTFDLKGNELKNVVRRVSEITGENIVIRNGVSGRVSGFLQDVPFQQGMNTILKNSGFIIREREGIYTVDRSGRSMSKNGEDNGKSFWVNVNDGLISMDVTKAKIPALIREIAFQTNVNLINYELPQGRITAKTTDLTLEETLAYLFRGTNVTYRKENDIYIIGDKSTSGIATNELIELQHIRADVAIGLIPQSIIQGATVKVVKEQNGLMVIGTNDIILELKSFIEEIDHPTPQILIEALVVDLKSTDLFELGATLGYSQQPDSGFASGTFATFMEDGLTIQGDGPSANSLFEIDGDLFGINNLGVLPDDFYYRINALSQEGVMNVRSRPQISTLNGHKASIEIGTTQYYILKSSTPLKSQQDVVVQEDERFETIEANVSLEITPWVSASGGVTTEIHPEFNTPVGDLNSDVPPTIQSRVLDSTVRLKDGETIVLGGLIQEKKIRNLNKVPILGDIPLLGKLFTNRSTDKQKSELVIFLTPHVFYGDDSDSRRWRELREDLDVDIEK